MTVKRNESKWLWRIAVWSFLAAVSVASVEAATGPNGGQDGTVFTFSQVALLVAVGAAWGDNRTNRTRDREEFKALRDEFHEFVKEARKHDE